MHPSEAVFDFLDSQRRVSNDIYAFYSCLAQYSALIVQSAVEATGQVEAFPDSVQCFLQHFATTSMTRPQVSSFHSFMLQYESGFPVQYRFISKHIPRAGILHPILRRRRQATLHKEKWHKAFIDLNDTNSHLNIALPVNSTGTFRCPLQLAKDQLDIHGLSVLQRFRRCTNAAGERTFSCPIDGIILEKYSDTMGETDRILCVDVYCDGVCLPNGDTQSISPLRVRFPNIGPVSTHWWDVGLCPTLLVGKARCTKLAELRRELFQRFLFLVLKPLIEASITGFQHSSTFVYPRVFMVSCDQKQERPFFCLKSAGGTRDCTLCDMVSRQTAAEIASIESRRNHAPSHPERNAQTPLCTPAPDQNIAVDRHGTTTQHATRSSSRPQRSPSVTRSSRQPLAGSGGRSLSFSSASSMDSADTDDCEVLSASQARQLDPAPAQKRNVVRMLSAQLVISIANIVKGGASNSQVVQKLRKTLSPHWFDRTDKELQHIRQYLLTQSGCEMPPALGAVHGLGTEPFFLYDSIAFDSLHAIDIGVIRLFADKCYHHFNKKQFTTLPTTQCLLLANERLRRVPRGAHLPNVTIFPAKQNDLQPGMTGLVRRQTCPFLWISLLGLNNKVDPDHDPLLQLALELDFIHAQLLGANADVQSMHRSISWIKDLQHRAFQLGVEFVKLFDVNIATKLHRVMRHIETHLTSFGMVRWGANDGNEKDHKKVKAAYQLSNRRQEQIAVQIVRFGYADDTQRSSDGVDAEPTVIETNKSTDPHVAAAVSYSSQYLDSDDSITNRVASLLNQKYASRKTNLWSPLSYITLQTNIPWSTDGRHQYVMEKYTYRQWCTCGDEIRMDACIYQLGQNCFHGFVQTIVRLSRNNNSTFIVLRRLTTAATCPGNTAPALKYGHTRLKYATNSYGQVTLDIVPVSSIQYPQIVVVDPTVLVSIGGIHATDVNALECNEHQLESRFFKLSTVRLTSFRESLSTDDGEDDQYKD